MNAPIDISGIVLTTDRLILRSWHEEDLEDFYAYAKVDGVGQMAGWLPHDSIDVSQSILSSFIQSKNVFALEYHGKVIGSLGVERYKESQFPALADKRGREIGYVLSKDYWGQGLMSEAVNAVLDWLLLVQQLDFVMVGHFDWNTQSRRVIEKCGFQFLCETIHPTRYETVENCREYILTRECWEKRRLKGYT